MFAVIFFFSLIIFFPAVTYSQEEIDTNRSVPQVDYFDQYVQKLESNNIGGGKITVFQDYRIKNLVNKQIRIESKEPGYQGYRIQIFFDSGSQARVKANEVKSKFLTLYPDMPAYLSYEQPFFKIRVGDFRNMLEAQGFKNVLSSEFSNAFIVSDKINTGY